MPSTKTTLFLTSLLFPNITTAQDNSCVGCVGNGRKCIGDQAIQAINDEDCAICLKSTSEWTWPCSVDGLCWCWDTDKLMVKQALSSGFEVANKKPCDLFSEKAFNALAPNAIYPYTYEGLCESIEYFNERYDEKLFMMGTVQQQRGELAAFLGHTTHESAQYTAVREALPCARTTEQASGVYCKPCDEANFDWANRYCEVSKVANGQFYEDYCDKIVTPPHGCVCGPTTEVDQEDLKGLMNPNFAFFGRGAIQLSWNANYLKASQVLTESSDTLCSQPDLVATEPKYAWGTALWFWLFQKPDGQETTCHIEALNGRFGGTLNIINGKLECPPVEGSYHAEAIVTRLRYYCIAATIMDVNRVLSFEGCVGLAEAFEDCVMTGWCPECVDFFKPPSMQPTKAPTVKGPTNQPSRWRSWADKDWMSEIKRRDSSSDRAASVLSSVTFLVMLYLVGQ
mmetsp:Transcript_28650/g.60237  ORF Transcript_28650/g.60237 Transcript_28650/m.60237 type:complete len:454 (-) Transcript_28650:111-1472(-)|eukprot:CAMPEP_0171328788 /NCGR_PEP_ID=MMETSP0878-20121228/852_1 /TAXON_ID=67004 /ORGANISM="Thalassiosira weissflogii, Strain CCMP1336" /LENGTH=453 /DNA_ID=CAMNT_0011828665 /DNA_START=127 /DNA_END=1488 /DNA_ORIENTATION=+